MSACIERSLYIGITQTKFDIFDNVKLRLNNGKIVEGEIIGLGDETVLIEDADSIRQFVSVMDIDDYLN